MSTKPVPETKPISNAPPQMQRWARWVDQKLYDICELALARISTRLNRIDANDIRYQENIAELQYQIKYLTEQLKSATDFASLQSSLNNSGSITTVKASAPTTPVQQTVIFTASGSASWAGSNLITGSGTYTDANMMYQGPAAGSQKTASFWFSTADLNKLNGKTISSASIYVKNRHFYYNAGGTVNFGTHGYQSAIRPTTQTNAFSADFNYGEGKWIPLDSSLYASIVSGSIKGFSIGINATDDPSDYSYFDGATKTYPPKLKVTYT